MSLTSNNLLLTSMIIQSIHIIIEITQKNKQDRPSDYTHKLEVNSDEPGAESVSNMNMKEDYKIKKSRLNYY